MHMWPKKKMVLVEFCLTNKSLVLNPQYTIQKNMKVSFIANKMTSLYRYWGSTSDFVPSFRTEVIKRCHLDLDVKVQLACTRRRSACEHKYGKLSGLYYLSFFCISGKPIYCQALILRWHIHLVSILMIPKSKMK